MADLGFELLTNWQTVTLPSELERLDHCEGKNSNIASDLGPVLVDLLVILVAVYLLDNFLI